VRLAFVDHADTSCRSRLCTIIKRHIAKHPLAADTAQGILASWLPQGSCDAGAEHIESALGQLVAEGWLRRHTLPDGRVLYAANPLNHPDPDG